MNETNLKRLHIVRFQLYDILKKWKLQRLKKLIFKGLLVEITMWKTGNFQGSENILYSIRMGYVYSFIHLAKSIEPKYKKSVS